MKFRLVSSLDPYSKPGNIGYNNNVNSPKKDKTQGETVEEAQNPEKGAKRKDENG